MQKVVCAWCGGLMQDGNSEHVSHGMCQTCAAALKASCPCPTCRRVSGHDEGCDQDRPWAV